MATSIQLFAYDLLALFVGMKKVPRVYNDADMIDDAERITGKSENIARPQLCIRREQVAIETPADDIRRRIVFRISRQIELERHALVLFGSAQFDSPAVFTGIERRRIEIRQLHARSEERRVGKECRSRWSP